MSEKHDPITALGEMFDSIVTLDSLEKAGKCGSGTSVAKAVRRKMGQTGWEYCCNLRSPTSPRPDFTEQMTRDGYMYRYYLRHAYLVCIGARRNYGALFGRGPPSSVCAIGGGPGCDILGLMMACKPSMANSKVNILDRCREWEHSWNAMLDNLPSWKEPAEVTYHHFEFEEKQLSPTQAEVVRSAAIITMVKSLSPVTAMLREQTPVFEDGEETTTPETSLYAILHHMSPGSLFLYIDNKVGTQRSVLEDTLAHLSFTVVDDQGLGKGAWLPSRDVFADSSRQGFRDRLKSSPCTRAGKNEMILLRKN